MIVWRDWTPECKFYVELKRLDDQIAETVAQWRCPHCSGRLHRADYPRKVHGVDEAFEGLFARRVSFCCSRDGCRRRLTPPSLRFWGRKWFALAIVLVACQLGLGGADYVTRAVEAAGATMAASTVRRWLGAWRMEFPATAAWQWLRARLGGEPPAFGELPGSLMERLAAVGSSSPSQLLTHAIGLLAQAGQAPWSTSLEGRRKSRRLWTYRAVRADG